MCQFPHGTVFSPIDDIDQCVLFVASGQLPHVDIWSENAFHIAAWHSDLIGLADEKLIDGIVAATEIEWRKAKREELRADLRRQIEGAGGVVEGDPLDGAYVRVGENKYPLSDFFSRIEKDELLEELEDSPRRDLVIFDSLRPVKVTPKGWVELERLLQDEPVLSSFERLRRLAEMGLYDTAIRDAGVLLETALRQVTGSRQYGMRLVDAFTKKLETDEQWPNSAVKRFRTDLRTAFKFIRNEFAHQVVQVPHDRALALLVRLASLIESVKESG